MIDGESAVDLFAGPGGWSKACHELGIREVGLELDGPACATRAVAGFATVQGDVASYSEERIVAEFGDLRGLIASPPCQDFSRAGRRKGITGERGRLVWEVLRWAEILRPQWIACEQVPEVLPIWREFARRLQGMGYRTWAGKLRAEQYGVPQTRERAILMARLGDRPVVPPVATHQRYVPGVPRGLPDLFDANGGGAGPVDLDGRGARLGDDGPTIGDPVGHLGGWRSPSPGRRFRCSRDAQAGTARGSLAGHRH